MRVKKIVRALKHTSNFKRVGGCSWRRGGKRLREKLGERRKG